MRLVGALYVRKSNKQSDRVDEEKSVKRQISRGREFASQKLNCDVPEEFVFMDDAISGAEFEKREDLMRLLRCLKQKPRPPFHFLVIMEEARIGRETIEIPYLVKQIVQAGVRVFSYQTGREWTLDSPMDKIMLSLTAFADELKRVKDSQTVYDTFASKASRGHVVGAIVFGYDNVPILGTDGKKSHVVLRVSAEQAAVVRRIFNLSARGYGYTRIAKMLNAEGAPAPKPKAGRQPGWSASTVKVILDRRLYLGEVTWGMRKKRDKWGRTNPSRRPEADWIRRQDDLLRIVSNDEWAAAHNRLDGVRERLQAIGAAAGNRRSRDVDSPFLLSGHARCGNCGGSLGVLSGGRARRRVYGCARAHKTGLCSNRVRVPIERVDDAVLHAIVDQVLTEAVVESVVDRVLDKLAPDTTAHSVAELRTALHGVEREIKNIGRAIRMGDELVGDELESLVRELRACEKRREGLRAALDGRVRIQARCLDRTALAASVHRRVGDWRALLDRRPEQGRQLLREMLAGPITFTPAGGAYQFRGQASFGALAGEASGTPLVVPVRGFEPRSRG